MSEQCPHCEADLGDHEINMEACMTCGELHAWVDGEIVQKKDE